MRKREIVIDFDILKNWVLRYFEENGRAPRSEDFVISRGAPYNRSAVFQEYGNLKNLYSKIGINPRSETSEEEKECLLLDLNISVYMHRTTDRDILRQRGLKDRSVYERCFGSWSNALKLARITEVERTLLRYFDSYMGEEPIGFLIQELGENGDFTDIQYKYIEKAKNIGDNVKKLRNSFNANTIKKHFKYMSLLQIICEYGVNLNWNSGKKFLANDGHECDSSQEKELDDWLYFNGFIHDVHIKYPDNKMICDFKVGDLYIEFAGLMNTDSDKYRNKIQRKINYCEENNLRLIIVDKITKENLERLRAALAGNSY